MTWPDPEEIQFGLATATRPIEVILQIGTDAMEQENDNPSNVARRLKKYDGLISRILLDKSMGKGLGMDAIKLIPFARAISDRFPELGLGAAGGLGPDTTHLVSPLLEKFPDLSFDAQSKLHPNGNILLPVDLGFAKTFLLRSLALTG
ncbi:hypothetical protein H6784_05135 [Candidatus Nomurabacteria bacterium]|nr:hypothetical protein [Candidatus Kaiserbacteria bacterium]MCB9814767.1 hypothetical protein [Candidatus Nomurabacteria bacterium]